MLTDFHQGIEAPPAEGARKIPSKKTLLNKLKAAHEWRLELNKEREGRPAQVARESSAKALLQIDQVLEKG
jgi:hypothetical protein